MANSDDIDRLTNLPEHILLHILSFLPTETAAATTVLSKTWHSLWTLVPDLDFDQSRRHKYQYGSFANFVTKALLHRRERFIRRFRLKCHKPYGHSDSDPESWLSTAIARNVQELDLDLGSLTNRFHCTQQSFKTLVVLKLSSVVIGGLIDDASFPVLKIFDLVVAGYECPEIKFLSSGFPVLEELVIKRFEFIVKTNFEICLPKLRSLTLNIATNIQNPTHLVVNDLLGLGEANINFRLFYYSDRDESYWRSVMNVVKAVSNVKILTLSHSIMKEIELAWLESFIRVDDIPVFHNLVQVEVSFNGPAQEIMIVMLQKFVNLKCLTLCYEGFRYWEHVGREVDMEEVIQQTDVPNCLTSRLTTFCFREFQGSDNEMNATRYILENSLVLKNAIIFFSRRIWSEDERDILRKLLRKSPRGSEGCQLEFRLANLGV